MTYHSSDPEERKAWSKHWITKGFTALESVLAKTSGQYCVGDEVSMADCCLVPQIYNANRFSVDMKSFPIISKIGETLSKLPAFIRAHPSNQPDCPEDLK